MAGMVSKEGASKCYDEGDIYYPTCSTNKNLANHRLFDILPPENVHLLFTSYVLFTVVWLYNVYRFRRNESAIYTPQGVEEMPQIAVQKFLRGSTLQIRMSIFSERITIG
ncbi:hypothetical protein EUGRSUZ_H00501 [Eucalyptus grandis]|uniref:Uncharacterized protein n=2 Tax=Eucalyptus grandis TaxID=71139 RepID=A0A059AUW0_EUCGR|nr:hypothetical protein EUGRSUZ_H00501 [Eucalyptus grandis]